MLAEPDNLDKQHAIIYAHMGLAEGMARRYCKKKEMPHELEEYTAVAYYAVVLAVHNSIDYITPDVRQDVTRYIVAYIRRMMDEAFASNKIIMASPRSMRAAFAKGRADLLDVVRVEASLGAVTVGKLCDSELLAETMDIFPEKLQRRILWLKLQRCQDAEIAGILNEDVTIIKSVRRKMKEVFARQMD